METKTSRDRLTLTQYPILLWMGGVFSILFALWFVFMIGEIWFALLALGIGLVLVLVLAQITTIIADRLSGRLILRYWSPLLRSSKEYAMWEIQGAEVESSFSSDSGSRTYRVVFVLHSGERIPLHGYYSSGAGAKERIARQVNDFLGAAGAASLPEGQAMHSNAVQPVLPESQLAGETSGVHWVIRQSTVGSAPLRTWETSDIPFPGGVLVLFQKPPGMKDGSDGVIFGAISRLLFRRLIGTLGFATEDLPQLEKAQPLALLDARLREHFAALTTHPGEAQRLLTPWVTNALEEWACRNPLRRLGSEEGDLSGELVVLFSPRKLVLVLWNASEEGKAAELGRLGVDIARQASVSLGRPSA